MPQTLTFLRHQSIFRALKNFFNQYDIYLYTTGFVFFQHVFLFCTKLSIFSQHDSLFWVSNNSFLLPQHIFFVIHLILVRNVTFIWNTSFLLTQHWMIKFHDNKKKLMLHKNVIHVNKSKIMLHQKYILCLKMLLIFLGTARYR